MAAGALSTLPEERQSIILARLARDGRALAAELASEFGISEDTIRRDLRMLAASGRCRRVYGGALPLSPAFGTLAERSAAAPRRKAALGAAGVRLIRSQICAGQVLFLDAGSINLAIARALPPGLDITVVTNAPAIAAALGGRPGIDLVVLGGRIDPRAGAALGARALREAREVRADLAILGACAVSAETGLAAFTAEEAEFKRAIAAASPLVAAAVMNDRLGTTAPFRIMAAAALADLVVEACSPEIVIAPLRALDIRVHRAEPVPPGIA